MKQSSNTRRYRMKARARAAEQTAANILAAASELWRERGLDEITLQEIADRADVTVQTVIRRFGSKDGVIDAAISADAAGVRAHRDEAPSGDIEGALDTLMGHYERDGDAVLRTLDLEHKLEAARAIVAVGRVEHRKWCARVFGPRLPDPTHDHYTAHLDACVAATDIYVWKLFRRDLGRSAEEVRRAMLTLLTGAITHNPN